MLVACYNQICFCTFVSPTWVWSVFCVVFVCITVCLIIFCPVPRSKKNIFRFMSEPFPAMAVVWFTCFAVEDWPSLKKRLKLVSQFASPLEFFFPLLCLALVWFSVSRPQTLVAAWFCLQPNASLACRQINITVSHSALIVSVFVKTTRVLKCRMF